jgi:hypothetical protein
MKKKPIENTITLYKVQWKNNSKTQFLNKILKEEIKEKI